MFFKPTSACKILREYKTVTDHNVVVFRHIYMELESAPLPVAIIRRYCHCERVQFIGVLKVDTICPRKMELHLLDLCNAHIHCSISLLFLYTFLIIYIELYQIYKWNKTVSWKLFQDKSLPLTRRASRIETRESCTPCFLFFCCSIFFFNVSILKQNQNCMKYKIIRVDIHKDSVNNHVKRIEIYWYQFIVAL